jgi:hypothetical protein
MCLSGPFGRVGSSPDSTSNVSSIICLGGDLARPGPGPADRSTAGQCAQLLDVDLASLRQAAAKVEPYPAPTAPGSGACCSLSACSGRRAYGRRRGATSTIDEPGPLTRRQHD